MGTQLGGPILVNLNGDFTIPRDGVPYVVGEINPDLRLEHLDAFLQQLNDLMRKDKGIEFSSLPESLNSGIAQVIAGMAKQIKLKTKAVDCNLRIECEIDPATKKMTYNFSIKGSLE